MQVLLRNRRSFWIFAAGFCTAITCMTFYRWLNSNSLANKKRYKAVFFGDSITQHGFNTEINGWVARLSHWWSRRVDCVNRGYSGYNTRWAKLALQSAVIDEKPDFFILFFGANDAIDESAIHHVPLSEYRENLKSIISKVIQKFSKIPIILITAPPVYEPDLETNNRLKGKSLLRDRTNERTFTYVKACKDIATEFSIPVVDAWSIMEGESNNRAEYLSDGLHLSAKGCDRLSEAITATITKHFSEWTPELLHMHLPEWSQIDYKTPANSFK